MARAAEGRKVGLIGYPVGHSLSPLMQQAAFDHLHLACQYGLWETAAEELVARVLDLRWPDYLGANVTVPYKQQVIPLLDRLDEEAAEIGAVNVIVNHNGQLVGHNSDAAGFLRSLREDGGCNPAGKHVWLLGAGGAAHSVAHTLVGAGVASLTILNRTLAHAESLADALRARLPTVRAVALAAIGELEAEPYDLLVNATAVGLSPAEPEASPVPANLLRPHTLVVDLLYKPTRLLREAKACGARTLDGLPMLVYQGARSFELWTGQSAPLAVMFAALREAH